MVQGQLYSKVEPLDPVWLWELLIIEGDLSLLVGPGGIGKGYLTADIIARVTRGWPMPDGVVTGPAGSVVLISPEDTASFTTVHRLTAAGADLSKVLDLTEAGIDGTWMITPQNLSILRRAILSLGDCRLVVIDPLMAVAPCSISNNVTVRTRIVGPLQALAADLGVAILLVHHPVKSGAVAGSQGLTDAARVVSTIELDADNEDVRLVRPMKSNLARKDQSGLVRFTIEADWPDTRVEYIEGIDQELDEQEAEGEPKPGSGQAAILKLLRAADGPLSSQQLTAQTGLPNLTVRVYLSRLKEAGLAESPARGAWSAAPAVTNAVTSAFHPVSL